MKKILLFIAILLGLSSVPLLAQGLNMSRYITITVVDGQDIRMNLRAASDNTPVRIVSGNNTQNIIVNNTWYADNNPDFTVTADGNIMTIYGNISEFSCAYNQANITGLDVSNNPQLKYLNCFNNQIAFLDVSNNTQLTHLDCESNLLESLDLSNNLQLIRVHCYNNRFNTAALNMLYCSLPVRPSNAPGECFVLNTNDDDNYDTLVAATSNNARVKNWAVKYYNNGNAPQNDVPSAGRFSCDITPNMSKVITLNVVEGQAIKLDFKAAAENTPVRIVSGSQVRNILVGTEWFDGGDPKSYTVTSRSNTMTIYGEVTHLDFSNNDQNVTRINASGNPDIKEIYGANNKLQAANITGCDQLSLLNLKNNVINAINLSTNSQLEYLDLSNNLLSIVEVENNPALKFFNCSSNQILLITINTPSLKTLNCANNKIEQLVFPENSKLSTLNCANNQISLLNINSAVDLKELNCSNNKLKVLNISNNTLLNKLNCSNNKITTLNLSNNTQLTDLVANSNVLTEINVSDLPSLRILEVSGNQIPSLDVTNNSNLEVVKYHNNAFDTEALNILYCALPSRETNIAGKLSVAVNTEDEKLQTVLASNAANARAKNWEVKYKNDTDEIVDIPTTGTFACGDPVFDPSKFITLTVVNGKNIKLAFKSANPSTPIRIVSGNTEKRIIVGTSWTSEHSVTSDGTTMTVYGNISGLKASNNAANLTGVDFANAPVLTNLDLSGNALTEINVASLTELQELNLTNNQFSAIDVTSNTKLTKLSVGKNNLTDLNISNNIELIEVGCEENKLTALDLTVNTKLKKLNCYKNLFTTGAINEIYCSLPRVSAQSGLCYPLYNDNDDNYAQVAAATSANATNKGWRVLMKSNNSTIQSEGSFACFNPNMNSFITLKVTANSSIKMDFKAATPKADIRFVSDDKSLDMRIGTEWYNTNKASSFTYTPKDTILTIYGDITGFNCSDNKTNIKNVDVSNNQELRVLKIENNKLASIDLKYNAKLTALHASNNKLEKLDVSKNTQLAELFCDNNLITKLDVSNNNQLVTLNCYHNTISILDVSHNTALEYLNCAHNQIFALDINSNSMLKELVFNTNQVSTISLANNSLLTKIDCSDNLLSALDLSANNQVKEVICFNNLFSTQVVNEIYCSLPTRSANEKGNIYTANTLNQSNAAISAATSDNAREKNWNVKTYNNGNNQADIPSKGSYSCSTPTPNTSKFIKLAVSNKKNINLNFKANAMNTLVRIVTGKTTQDITVGTDWYSQNFKVTSDGKMIVIYGDISEFSCSNNNTSLKHVDISNNPTLEFINCSNNALTTLDLSKNPRLETVYCNTNQLTELNLTNNGQLSKLVCYNNPFTTEAINNIYCSLPMGRSDSTSVIYTLSDSTDANNEVVVAATSNNARDKNWKVKYLVSDKDIKNNGAYFCPNAPTPNMRKYVRISVANKENIKLSVKAANGNTPVQIASGKNVKNIIVGTDWYTGGMKDGYTFTAADTAIVIYGDIVALDCSNNKRNVSFVDITNNNQLKELNCAGNRLTTIDVRRNGKLTSLNISKNLIEDVDVSNSALLNELNASYNKLSSINVSKNYQLKALNLNSTELIDLDVTNNTLLETLKLDSNNLVKLNITYNKQLVELSFAKNLIKDIDLSNNKQLKKLYCGANELSSLDFTNNTVLEELDFSANLVNYVDLRNNVQLVKLNASNNHLTLLDVANNVKLTDIDCSNNQLLSFYVSTNLLLENLSCAFNSINHLDMSNNAQLVNLHCQANQLTNLDLSNNIRLKNVICYGNPFTTEAINNFYCSLPTVNGETGLCYPLFSRKDDNYEQVSVATSKNARDKNWEVKYFGNKVDISSKGKFTCEVNPVDMSKVITLTAATGKAIHLDFKAAKENTSVRIVSGSSSQNIVVGTDWYDGDNPSKFTITPDVSTVTIYGAISAFNCSKNETNITEVKTSGNQILEYLYCADNGISSLDLSNNAKLVEVHCYKNPFTTDAINELYCSLVADANITKKIYPLNTADDANHAQIVAATSKNARDKNWEVKYLENKEDIASNGNYDCFGDNPKPDMYKFITLNVKSGEAIKLNFKASRENTPVRIVSGNNTQDVIVGTEFIDPDKEGKFTVTADGETMTIYGDIEEFSCQDNEANVTGVDASNHIRLQALSTANNEITTLDVSKNINLSELYCYKNQLTELDLSKNTKLIELYCFDNKLTNLDVNANVKLRNLFCYNNPFTTEVANYIYCSLPEVDVTESAQCALLDTKEDENHEAIAAATSDNARKKNWKVIYNTGKEDVPNAGNFDCSTGVNEAFSGIVVFPNPARANVMIQLDSEVNETLILVDLTGRALLNADVVAGKANIDVSKLTAGTYFIKVGNRVQKLTVK